MYIIKKNDNFETMKKSYLIFAFSFIFVHFSFSQSYTIDQLNMADGLSNDYVVAIEGDKEGYIWFATEEGLNRYDGSNVVTFHKNQNGQNSVSGNDLNKIVDDSTEKILWIATKRDGLCAYNYATNTFTTYKQNNGQNTIISNAVTDIETSLNGNLWLATYNSGVDYFDKSNHQFTHYNKQTIKSLVSNYAWSVVDDGNNNLYIGHKDAGLSIINLKTKQSQNYQHKPNDKNTIPSNDVRCVYKDKSGGIWVGTSKGLALFNPITKKFTNFGKDGGPLSMWITDIAHFKDDHLWVSTRFDGIVKINLSQLFLTSITDLEITKIGHQSFNDRLSSLNTRCLYQDKFNNVWTGTWGGGANFLSKKQQLFNNLNISKKDTKESSIANSILSISQDKDETLWIGTYGAGVYKLKNNKIKRFTLHNNSLNLNTVQAIHTDKHNNLWFGVMHGGVIYYNKKNNKAKQILPNIYKNSDITAICETSEGIIMVGTNDNGVFLFDANTSRFIKKLEIKEGLIRSIVIDQYDNILIGTYGIGMRVYSKEFKLIKSYHTQSNFISNIINHIYKDAKNNIWVATGDGLIMLNDKYNNKYQVYAKSKNIRAIIEDGNNNIWYSRNKGLSCITRNNTTFNYSYKDNINLSSFSSACVLKNKINQLFFGSLHGVCFFTPDKVLEKKEPLKPFFTLLEVYEPIKGQFIDKKQAFISGKNEINLNYKQNNFKVSFAIKNYAQKNKVDYSYMLKGLSNSWYPVQGTNEIPFRNVASGRYQLLLRSRVRNQDWSKNYRQLNINVHPPIWLSWWAKLLYITIVFIISLGLMFYRERKIKVEYLYKSEKQQHQKDIELNLERIKFYTNITHELRTPLTLISGPIEDILNSATLSDKDKKRLLLIHKNTVRLKNLVNRLLDFRKTETSNKNLVIVKADVVTTVKEIAIRFKELNQNPNVTISIKATPPEIYMHFDQEAINMIIDNLMSNATKYTQQGSINIQLAIVEKNDEEYVEINVKDTGTGISKNDLPKIFDRYYQKEGEQHHAGTGIGLALVKNLVTLHEGFLTANSSLGIGTSISFFLKLNNTYPNAAHTTDEKYEEDEIPQEEVETFDEDYKIDDTVVLVIEDNKDICEYIYDELNTTYEVQIANNGKQGLHMALDNIPDIIISDVMMPEMDGFELCKKLKEDIRTCHIPIILLTAKDSSLSKEEGYTSGADSYLTKPFSSNLLKSRLKNLLTQRQILAKAYSNSTNLLNTISNIKEQTNALSGLDKDFIEKATRIITDNISEKTVDVQFLSDQMFMSNSTLYRKMKAITDLSTTEFIRKIKMIESEKLLQEKKYNLTEIAYKVGINSQVYFRKCFKEQFGCTPSEYLKK
ncbi:two-component regulator propeller domain-containing protein [Wenyingzhuangia sp. chi5]|uniref:histidine kinase n=1 Tax=Wenyingzhuangia gilva TaxID=3057677 RepID=A0ABT8VTP3_9FLAO|nr:two-component regulator propeller domain-containing protein [Wenyingzhuangia sp. chi5]MDO3695331.1 two-component regulator propeller domain-containing protein [Wenyingzhuangia sp. chi5]